MSGKLYLIPTYLNGENPDKSIIPYLKSLIKELQEFIVEDEKSARRFIKSIHPATQIGQLILHPHNKHDQYPDMRDYLKPLLNGTNMGMLSEAGCPAIADPGAGIVRAAHREGIQVVPLVGPSSVLLALMASGFNGQHFCFRGYLLIDKQERKRQLQDLERQSERSNQTQIFIETPFRNNQLLEDILNSCQPSTELCIACDLTGENEYISTRTLAEWKNLKPELHKRPAIFLLYRRV